MHLDAHRSLCGGFVARPRVVRRPGVLVRSSAAQSSGPKRGDPSRLNDPARIGAEGSASARVLDAGGDNSLSAYMQLPVEQYFVLDPSQIRFLGGNRFLLKVPRVHILNVWLEPEVEIAVTTTRSRVCLRAENCRIRGSDLIEKLRLDERFCLRFDTELSWLGAGMGGASSASSSGSSMDDTRPMAPPAGYGEITGTCELTVWSEVIPPFNLMPREMLQSSCNLVLRGLVGNLLPLFVRMLAEDYERWSRDPAYRQSRSSRAAPLESAMV